MTEKSYRVAIAGCHRMTIPKLTNHNFAAAFAEVPYTEIVAVFDRGAQTRANFVACWGEVPTYDDYGRMLQEIQPDILCIATRQTMHADQIEQAAAAGVRGILCDKPLATSLAAMDRIVAACRTHKIPLTFALDRRWMPPYYQLCDLIEKGTVGAVTSISAHGLPNLINHGCHWYDTALMLVGDPEPIWVSGFVHDVSAEPPDSRRRLDPAGHAQVGLSNGAILSLLPDGGNRPSFMITGDKGRLMILDDAREAYLWTAEQRMSTINLPSPSYDWPAGLAMVADLVGVLEYGGATGCDIEHARRATEIGFAIHLSHAQAGRRITLPATERTLTIPSFPWGNE
ncbi:MAG: Gfo/Idh/MocA family oxidoreductase [Caldilineaceae bacterium]